MSVELNPCPNCGGQPKIHKTHKKFYVECDGDCWTQTGKHWYQEDAVKEWNTQIAVAKEDERTTDTKLLPCPFCGGEAVLYHQSSKYTEYDGDYVYCFRGCGCRTKLFECYNGTGKTHADTEKEAIEAWNRRADK